MTARITRERLKMGRPSKYNKKVGDEICLRIAGGESLKSICRDDHIPALSTVMGWVIDNSFPDFSNGYARARQLQVQSYMDELTDIADNEELGTIEKTGTNAKGDYSEIITADRIEHRKLMIDTRKFIASKLAPKIYGPKLAIPVDDDGTGDNKTTKFIVENAPNTNDLKENNISDTPLVTDENL